MFALRMPFYIGIERFVLQSSFINLDLSFDLCVSVLAKLDKFFTIWVHRRFATTLSRYRAVDMISGIT
jgi:hypothetical protein